METNCYSCCCKSEQDAAEQTGENTVGEVDYAQAKN